jgi:hypothetical protein
MNRRRHAFPAVPVLRGCLPGPDHTGHHFGQMVVARDDVQHLGSGHGMGPGTAAAIDGHCLDDPAAYIGSQSAKTNIRGLMVAATRRTPRPMNSQRAVLSVQMLLQRLGQFLRSLLGLDLCEITEFRAHTRYQSAEKW